MKKVYYVCLVLLVGASGCGKRVENAVTTEQRMFQIDSVDQVTGVQRMQVSRVEQEITCNGVKYALFIERTPSDSLSQVHTDLGIFIDNRINVRITRADGRLVFAKMFTKQDFSEWVEADDLRYFILEGLVFDEEKTADGKNIVLAASISYPQSDLYIPFSLTVTPEGKMHIVRSEDMEEFSPLSNEEH